MFEQKLTRTERLWRDLRWLLSPERCSILTLRDRARRALGWFVAGALLAAVGAVAYAHQYPGDVVVLTPVLEHADNRFHLVRLRMQHRGVEVECHLVIKPEQSGWTLRC